MFTVFQGQSLSVISHYLPLNIQLMGICLRKAVYAGTSQKPSRIIQEILKSGRNYHSVSHCHYQCVFEKGISTSTLEDTYKSQIPSLILSKNYCTTYQTMSLHVKARCEVYPRTQDVKRFIVPDDKVPWSVDFPEYAPIDYTSKSVASQPVWADNPDPATITFNCIDKSCNSDRRSNEGNYQVINGCPRNPRGRTGCKGRGTLGKWGPNHAADPIVTRWQRDSNNEIVKRDGKPVLEFVAVQRRDNGEWALPGGMVDPGENRTATLTREFGEEALNSIDATPKRKAQIEKLLTEFFKNGKTIYKGYVDDPRNTDNAWMETKAMNFHDEQGTSVGAFSLHAGDDAADVKWMPIDKGLKLYASHIDFIRRTVKNHGAYW